MEADLLHEVYRKPRHQPKASLFLILRVDSVRSLSPTTLTHRPAGQKPGLGPVAEETAMLEAAVTPK